MRPDTRCPFCHGAGEIPLTRDPDINIDCLCTYPTVEGKPVTMLNTLDDVWEKWDRTETPLSLAVKDSKGRLYLLGSDGDFDFYQGLPIEADENGETVDVNNSRLYDPSTIGITAAEGGPAWPLELLGFGSDI